MDWAGFQKLRPGRIHIYCPKCGRKMSNGVRGEYDPPRAELVHVFCERCGAGGKEACEVFLDGRGREIPWREVEAQIVRVVKARTL